MIKLPQPIHIRRLFSGRSLEQWTRLAVFAVLLNALAPLVTALLVAHDPVGFDALCSAQLESSHKETPAKGDLRASCGYCVTHAGSYALAAVLPAASELLAFVPPRPEPSSPDPAPATPRWYPAQPRAPPFV